jgi:hypothetical protein
MTTLLFNCSSTSAATQIVADVEAGELWGVDMGTTSAAASYSNYVLIECTKTRNLAIIDAIPDFNRYSAELGETDPLSFAEATQRCKAWYLRGKLG